MQVTSYTNTKISFSADTATNIRVMSVQVLWFVCLCPCLYILSAEA